MLCIFVAGWRCPACRSQKGVFEPMTQTIAGFADNQQYGFGGNSMTEGQKVSLRLRTCVVFPRVILRVAVRVDLRELGRVLPALPQRLLDGVRQPGRGTSATKTSMRALSVVWGAKFDIPRPRVTAAFYGALPRIKGKAGRCRSHRTGAKYSCHVHNGIHVRGALSTRGFRPKTVVAK